MRKRAPCSRSSWPGRSKAKPPDPARIEFGAMLEVPSLAEMLDVLLPRIDFLSIGTNDLTQFLFAADRADPRLAERYDWLSPAILRFLRRIVVAGRCRRRAGAAVRRDGRPAAGGDGADRHRHPQFLDHPGGGRPGQGDGPLARRGGGRARKMDKLLAKPPRDMRKRADRLGEAARRRARLTVDSVARLRPDKPRQDVQDFGAAGDDDGR